MAVRLTYETHATTEDNERGIATGWLPGRLSPRGRREAALLGERRRPEGYAAVLVSDLARAVETVVIAFADSDVPVRPLQHLLDGTPLADVVTAPFDWQPGWEWTLA